MHTYMHTINIEKYISLIRSNKILKVNVQIICYFFLYRLSKGYLFKFQINVKYSYQINYVMISALLIIDG